ncbi:MAG: FkbM family methyltransferase [Sphingomicrobium sp.]
MRGPLKDQALRVLVNRGIRIGTVLDVGVLTETPELKAHFPEALHVLFEPVAEFIPGIERNYQGIRHEIANVAVSASTGETMLALESVVDVPGQEFSHSHIVSNAAAGATHRTVPMTTLDDFLEGRDLPEPYFLKIDIDGHELAAVAGATKTLKKCAAVMIEAQIAELPQRISAIVDQGFVLFDLAEPCYYDNALWQCDAILLREEFHQRHFAQLDADFDASKYSIFNVRLRPPVGLQRERGS